MWLGRLSFSDQMGIHITAAISLSIHATKPSISIASEKARLLHRQLEQASASIQNGFSGSLLFIIPDIKLAKIAVGDGLKRIDYNQALLENSQKWEF